MPCHCPAATEAKLLLMAAQTEIKASTRGHFITTADIDYTPIRVLIDTGATLVAMSYADADKAGLHPFSLDYSVPVSTANGIVKAAPATLKRVEVDNIVVYDVKALVLPKGALQRHASGHELPVAAVELRHSRRRADAGGVTHSAHCVPQWDLQLRVRQASHIEPVHGCSDDRPVPPRHRDAVRQDLRGRSRDRLLHRLRAHAR